jgi:hypothetical protein
MPVYSLALLTDHAQCDAVLAIANARLGTLTFRDTETDFRANNATKSAQSIASEMASLNTYITAMTPALAALPAGKEHDELADELRHKTNRRGDLTSQQRKSGSEKLLARELEQALLDPLVPIVQDFIAQVTTHRATLAS